MPGFATHYIFGRDTYQKLPPSSCKKNLYKNRSVYNFGLQGPDFFFYFLPSYLLYGKNPGSTAHTTDTQKFFRALLESCRKFRDPKDQRIAEAYLIGFLGHYTLDTICHPFVYGRTHYPGYQAKDYFSRHAYLETDIDACLLRYKMHCNPSSFCSANTIACTHLQKKVITDMLCYAYEHTYPEFHIRRPLMLFAIYSMQICLRILKDHTGQKKVLLRFAEKHILGYPLFSPLIASNSLIFRTDPLNIQHKPWTNPWDASLTSAESFPDLYKKAEIFYLRRLQKLAACLHCDDIRKSQELLHDFFRDFGNYSFHSGLDCSIPS